VNDDNGRRRKGLLLLSLPLVALLFWFVAIASSELPDHFVVAVNVHGLTLNPADPTGGQRPAPLSLSVLADARVDSTVPSASPTTIQQSPASSSAVPSTRPSARPTLTPTASPSVSLLPTPSLTPLPTPSPTPTPSAGSATIAGQVLDSQTRAPIAAGIVSASPGGSSTLTDANGNYSLSLAAGTYTVTASAATYSSASQTAIVKAGQKLILNFKLSSSTTYGSLTGTVVDSVTRAPIVGATVALSNGLVRVTDTNGAFSYSIVLSGTYTMTVSAVGYVTQTQQVAIKAGKTTTVQVLLVHS
jgi:hypothetical protein